MSKVKEKRVKLEAPGFVIAPHELKSAAVTLQDLVGKGAVNIRHHLANDTAENFQAIAFHIATCREALDEIEVIAHEQLAAEGAFYRGNWKAIKSLGVLKKVA